MLEAGRVRLGVLATMVDVSGAGIGLEAVSPDWIATADLSIHLTRPIISGEARITCTPLRVGARSVVVESTITDADEQPCGYGRISFARIPGTATDATVESVLEGGSPMVEPIAELCGIVPVGPGQLRLDKSGYIRNSFGTVNGGVLALTAEAAAVSAAGGGWATDLQIHYLEQIGDGPVGITAVVVRSDADGDHCLVRIEDRSDGRLCAISDVRVARPEPQ